MGFLDLTADPARNKLVEVRQTLLALHKALLDSERTRYEISHGPIGPPAAFLNLLLNDSYFAWLKPVTTLMVQIDEALAAKNPPATSQELDRLTGDTRALLTPSRGDHPFWQRYSATIQNDPAVAILHAEIVRSLNSNGTH